MWFDGLGSLRETLVTGLLAYVILVAFVRVSGKRTLSKMNAFDLVVTVALGSTLSSIVLSRDVSLADGAAGLFVLISLQLAVTWTSVRWASFERVVKSSPTLLAFRGRLLAEALRAQRVSDDELMAALRQAGLAGVGQVGAAVLETDGSISVVPASSLRESEPAEAVKGLS